MASSHAATHWHHFDDLEHQQQATLFGMWVFLATEDLDLRRHFYWIHGLSNPIRGCLRSREPASQSLDRRHQHAGPLNKQFDDGSRDSCNPAGPQSNQRAAPLADGSARARRFLHSKQSSTISIIAKT